MITFENEQQLREWVVCLENHVTMLKANLACEKRQCTVVNKTTDGFRHRAAAIASARSVKNCADMVVQYLGGSVCVTFDDEGEGWGEQ